MRIPIHVNMDNPQPIYHQVKEQLRDLILSGELPPGTLLPSIRGLSEQLGVSVITTRRVYQDLEGEKLLRTRQGVGTFIAEVSEQVRQNYREELLKKEFSKAIEAGIRMQFSKGEMETFFKERLEYYLKEIESKSEEKPSDQENTDRSR